MQPLSIDGFVVAAITPMRDDESVHLAQIGASVAQLLDQGAAGFYVCGSTGEGMSLTTAERRAVAEEVVRAVDGRAPVIIQVGHNSLAEARTLAGHAAKIGAEAISATSPSYFRVSDVDLLTRCMGEIADVAPDLPFYYYHIPQLTGVNVSMVDFLQRAGDAIRSLMGIKYTAPTVHEFQQCVDFDDGRFEVLWGTDEMALAGMLGGARAAVGSTYNVALPIYLRMQAAFRRGDIDAPRLEQERSVALIAVLCDYPFHAALKTLRGWLGHDCGPVRLPLQRLDRRAEGELKQRLESIGFFGWIAEQG